MQNNKGRILNINNKKYRVSCTFNNISKWTNLDDCMRVNLQVSVYDIAKDRYLKWGELKGTYISEKVGDYIQNIFK